MSNQQAAAIAAICQNVDWEAEGLDLQAIIEAGNQRKLGKPLTEWLVNRGWVNSQEDPPKIWCNGMVELYQKFMNLDIVPELNRYMWPATDPAGFNWLVFRPQGLTAQMALDKLCKPQFGVHESISVSTYSLERTPETSHLMFCRDTVQPDKNLLNCSADHMSTVHNVAFMDICDRIVLEAIYYFIYQKHLDIKSATICPRSRSRFGVDVAHVGYLQATLMMEVSSRPHDVHYPSRGGRQVIPLALKP